MHSWLRKLIRADATSTHSKRSRKRAALTLEMLEDRWAPAVYNVTGFADGAGSISGSGPFNATTLRAAIDAANVDPGADVINLPAGTYTISSELAITTSIDIEGAGAASTIIDAGSNSRVFHVSGASSTVTFDNITMQNGKAVDKGGGILIDSGTVNVTASIVNQNQAVSTTGVAKGGGIYIDAGTLNLTKSTVSGNSVQGDDLANAYGGGIASNTGAVTVQFSTVSGNQAMGGLLPNAGIPSLKGGTGGGGIANLAGTLIVDDSTIAENSAFGGGQGFTGPEGIGGDALGGGIYSTATTSVTNSTIAFNLAKAGQGNVHQATDAGKSSGGGFYDGAGSSNHPQVGSTIIAKNTVESPQNSSFATNPDVSSTSSFTSLDFNLIGDVGNATGFTGSHDQVGGGSNAVIDPLFVTTSVANNGGLTPTLALKTTSLAIGVGNPVGGPTTDQRGFPRDNAPDVGAYEAPPLNASFVVDTLADENDGDFSAGHLSLREAILLASAVDDANTITFAAAIAGGTIHVSIIGDTSLGPTAFLVSTPITIDGLTNSQRISIVRDNATSAMRLFTVASAGNLTLENITLSGGLAQGSGTAFGGGIFVAGGSLYVNASTIANNSVKGADGANGFAAYGGGIALNQGSVFISASTISGNQATGGEQDGDFHIAGLGAGGGIANLNGTLRVENSTIANNSAFGGGQGFSGPEGHGGNAFGGGIYSTATTTLTNDTIAFNLAKAGKSGHDLSGALPSAKGGGFYDGAGSNHPQVGSTIIAKNSVQQLDDLSAPETADPDVSSNSQIASLNFNLIGDVGSATGFSGSDDQVGTSSPIDPLFVTTTVADNGGPTKTLALQSPLSPAIGAANAGLAPTTDQRGVTRDSAPDIGTFEAETVSGDGNVDVRFRDGVLKLVGDKLGNAIQITAGAVGGSFVITGMDHTTVERQHSVTVSNVKSVVIKLLAGADTLLMGGASAINLEGRLVVRTGIKTSDSLVRLTNVTVAGRTQITSGKNVDTIEIVDAVFRGSFSIKAGRDANQIRIDSSRFERNVKLRFGQDADHVAIVDSLFAKELSIKLGEGDNEVDAGLMSNPLGTTKGNTFAVAPKVRGRVNLLS